MDPVWFRRFADIPGVQYAMPAGLDVSKLKRRNAVPEIDRFEESSSLWWETRDGGTSESPASEHSIGELREASVERIRRNLAEMLELPGEPTDYHFAIQNVAGELYGRRRQDPSLLDEVERLCLLDIQLIQALPATITYDHEGEISYYSVSAFSRLIRMFLTEGRVSDAAWVESVAERFGNGDATTARDRTDVVRAEDAP